MQGVERVGGAGCGARGKVAQRPIGVGERALAQVHFRRQALDFAAHHARGVAGLDLAAGEDRELLHRPAVMGERRHDVAVRVLGLAQRAVDIDADAPALDILAVEAMRRQAQILNQHAGRRPIAMRNLVRNPDPHGAPDLR